MPGPPKTPANLKLITGTVRKDRVETGGIDLPLVDEVPSAPEWLPNAHAANEWKRLAPILVANKLLAEADLSAFAHMCAVHGKMVQLWTAGETPTGHMVSQYNSLAAAFGLSPAWRSKVKPIGNKDEGNKFAKLKPADIAG
jgi:phage terminase small subunit